MAGDGVFRRGGLKAEGWAAACLSLLVDRTAAWDAGQSATLYTVYRKSNACCVCTHVEPASNTNAAAPHGPSAVDQRCVAAAATAASRGGHLRLL